MASRRGKRTVTAAQFFGQMCPRLISAMRAQLAEMGGRYVITVEGESGGTWTLDYDAGTAVGRADAGAALSLTMSDAQFASLAKPQTELRKLVSSGQVTAEGDLDKVENLSLQLAFLSGR